ncbi:hypothetical protein BGZ60DRAFT_414245 [Tricladium varicosporioides]|nr:hypothetical protein BGZ60DRAFT_414245 [Hymenoscyphus varicosporioides]
MASRTSTTTSASSKSKPRGTFRKLFTKQIARDAMQIQRRGDDSLLDLFFRYKPEDGRLVPRKRFQKRSGSRSGSDYDSDSDSERPKGRRKSYRGDKFQPGIFDDEKDDREVKVWRRTSKRADGEMEGREMKERRRADGDWAAEGNLQGGEQESGIIDTGVKRDVRL